MKWTNVALEKIPYDEYSLKSIPSKGSVLRKVQELEKTESSHVSISKLEQIKHNVKTVHPIEVLYPSNVLTMTQSREILDRLATTGVNSHWKYFLLSLGVSPFTLPLGLLPVVPNLPGIYLLYRAWCNWKAWEGAKHLAYLVKEDHLVFKASDALNEAYAGSPKYLVVPSSSSRAEKKTAAKAEISENSLKINGESEKSEENESSSSSSSSTSPTSTTTTTLQEVVILDSLRIEQVTKSIDATQDLSRELARAVHQVEKRMENERKEAANER